MASADTSIFSLRIGGFPLDTFRVLEFQGEETISKMYSFHIKAVAFDTLSISQWDFFSLYIGNVVTQGPGHLMGVISGVHGDPNAILSDVFERGILAANEINKSAGLSTLGFFIVGYSVFYMTVITVGYALYLIIMAKIALGILLGMAPLFGPVSYTHLTLPTNREV